MNRFFLELKWLLLTRSLRGLCRNLEKAGRTLGNSPVISLEAESMPLGCLPGVMKEQNESHPVITQGWLLSATKSTAPSRTLVWMALSEAKKMMGISAVSSNNTGHGAAVFHVSPTTPGAVRH
jgi:hypothetical protein